MKLRFFGRLRSLVEDGECDIDLPPDVATTEAVRSWFGRDHPDLLDQSVRMALDDSLVLGDAPLGAAREIAFLPPVSGG
ncbi:MoaD/ThiS family protein [Sphingomonas sp.]|uniref:MoaD/ThiS family protein n=1 Tax=Sphingomonas sp. TaxID=28214 RepID=UPI00286C8CE7|nr:MoaD/ThiS family protein [Sphingomonas sp.]